jgi:hypothetical protein
MTGLDPHSDFVAAVTWVGHPGMNEHSHVEIEAGHHSRHFMCLPHPISILTLPYVRNGEGNRRSDP